MFSWRMNPLRSCASVIAFIATCQYCHKANAPLLPLNWCQLGQAESYFLLVNNEAVGAVFVPFDKVVKGGVVDRTGLVRSAQLPTPIGLS